MSQSIISVVLIMISVYLSVCYFSRFDSAFFRFQTFAIQLLSIGVGREGRERRRESKPDKNDRQTDRYVDRYTDTKKDIQTVRQRQ